MNIEIDATIKLKVKGTTLKLTMEEARELLEALRKEVEPNNLTVYPPVHVPTVWPELPNEPTTPLTTPWYSQSATFGEGEGLKFDDTIGIVTNG